MNPTPEQLAKLPKWARQYLADRLKKSELISALRWTSPAEQDVPPPALGSNTLSKGFAVQGSGYYGRVEPACSSSTCHGIGTQDKTTSQQPIHLFSTRLLALRSLRYKAECAYAQSLLDIDRMIEAEGRRSGKVSVEARVAAAVIREHDKRKRKARR